MAARKGGRHHACRRTTPPWGRCLWAPRQAPESAQRSTILPRDALLVAHTMREWTGGGTKATSKCANDGEGPWKRALRYARLRCPAAADGSRARNIEATRWPSAFNSVKKKRCAPRSTRRVIEAAIITLQARIPSTAKAKAMQPYAASTHWYPLLFQLY